MTLELDPDRRLALAYVPAARRRAVEALWDLDVALGLVLATGSDAMISRIRLAWWRESLEKLDRERAPAEPVLQALGAYVIPAGITGAELAGMEEGWSQLLSHEPLTRQELEAYAQKRGGLLYRFSARLLGDEQFPVEDAGARWALTDLARHSSSPEEIEGARAAARDRQSGTSWPAPLRPLGMLAMLAARDLEREQPEIHGSPGRMLRMIWHRLSGH